MSNSVGEWYRIGADMFTRDLWTEVPLRWDEPNGELIDIFAREIIDASKLRFDLDETPALVYLEGGPAARGSARPSAPRLWRLSSVEFGRDLISWILGTRARAVRPGMRSRTPLAVHAGVRRGGGAG